MTRKDFEFLNHQAQKLPQSDDSSLSDDSISITNSYEKVKDPGLWRDLLAYWIFGMCNNFGYVVMLTAAHDIIGDISGNKEDGVDNDDPPPGVRPCGVLSTGAILLADTIPGLLITFISPFLPFWANVRVTTSCLIALGSYIVVAYAETQWVALAGVAMTSLACGFGEPTFLAYSAFFNKNVISTWSSGTGGAGIVGALAYTVMIKIGFSSRQTLLMMVAVPTIELLLFFLLLRKPASSRIEDQHIGEDVAEEDNVPPMKSIKEKLLYIRCLFRFMIPLVLVYFFEYFINQGLFELVYFPEIFLKASEQYRWYQVTYQIGVFVSRSSVNIIQLKHLWVMAVLQGLNVIFFFFEAVYMFTPSIWIIFVFIFYEGLLGGGAYVNTFYRMSKEIPATRREYSMGIVALSNSIGITLAGFAAMPSHNWMCGFAPGRRLLN